MAATFSDIEIEKLIDLVRERQCLWNKKPGRKDQSNKLVKENSWLAIAEKFQNKSVTDCQDKWDSLRSYFGEILRKHPQNAEEPVDDFERIKWQWFAPMTFLLPFIKPRKNWNHASSMSSDDYHVMTAVEVDGEEVDEDEAIGYDDDVNEVESRETFATWKIANKRARNNNNNSDASATNVAVVEDNSQLTWQLANNDYNDEDSLFALSLGKTLSRFPAHLKALAKAELLSVLAKFEYQIAFNGATAPPNYTQKSHQKVTTPKKRSKK